MSSTWQDTLAAAGAHWNTSGDLLDFGDSTAELGLATNGNIVSPLPLAVLRVSGNDAIGFLHGQLTNDVQGLATGKSFIAGYCTAKGRMLAILRLVRLPDAILVILPAEIADGIMQRLRMFVLRAKVVIERIDYAVIGISGPATPDPLTAFTTAVPVTENDCALLEDGLLLRLPSNRLPPRFLLAATEHAMPAYWASLVSHCKPTGTAAWRLLDIQAGLPAVLSQTQESFVPQMANLDLLGGLSFEKGCYPGQEIVARMHYLGTLKRRMYRIRIKAEAVPLPGTEIRDSNGTLIGELVMAARSPDGGAEGLAVLQIEHADTPDLVIAGQSIEVAPPPYPL
jgi:folate-binding protein YgfZ